MRGALCAGARGHCVKGWAWEDHYYGQFGCGARVVLEKEGVSY